MDKWEYRVIRIASAEGDAETSTAPLPLGLIALDAAGNDGWELMEIIERVNFFLCFFKRPLHDNWS